MDEVTLDAQRDTKDNLAVVVTIPVGNGEHELPAEIEFAGTPATLAALLAGIIRSLFYLSRNDRPVYRVMLAVISRHDPVSFCKDIVFW